MEKKFIEIASTFDSEFDEMLCNGDYEKVVAGLKKHYVPSKNNWWEGHIKFADDSNLINVVGDKWLFIEDYIGIALLREVPNRK